MSNNIIEKEKRCEYSWWNSNQIIMCRHVSCWWAKRFCLGSENCMLYKERQSITIWEAIKDRQYVAIWKAIRTLIHKEIT